MMHLKTVLLLIWLTTTVHGQVYDELRNGKQIAMELTIADTVWVNKNPLWFTGTSFNAHTEYGTLTKSATGDTLYLALRGVDDMIGYNPQYAVLVRDNQDWIAWHYDPSNSGYRFVFLRLLPDSPSLVISTKIFNNLR